MAEPPEIERDLQGPISPPRDNGELVFEAPWERRVFGVTVALCRSGRCDWESFRGRLIARIAEQESRPYWQSWTRALEDVIAAIDAVAPAELDDRHTELLARPHGHDHHR